MYGSWSHFSNSLIIQAVSEPVLKLMTHKNIHIRKKVAMVLYKFYQVDKNSVPDIEFKMRKLLCDFDPAVWQQLCHIIEKYLKKTQKK